MDNKPFDIKATPVVGYVSASGEVRNAIVNGVNAETGNPDLAVIKQVPDAPHNPNKAPGTWHYLDEQPSEAAPELEAAPAPVETETAQNNEPPANE